MNSSQFIINTQKPSMRDLLQRIPGERVFLKDGHAEITYAHLISHVETFWSEYKKFSGKKLAVSFPDRLSACLNLPAIAELAGSVFLQPAGLELPILEEFYQKSGIEFVVSFTSREATFEPVVHQQKKQEKNTEKLQDEFILATSGTSGVPKLVSYTLERLLGTAQCDVSIGERYVWGLVYDINRFAGLQVYLQAVAGGSTLVISDTNTSLEKTVRVFSEMGVNALSATPTFWRNLLMTDNYLNLPLSRITLGGEISDQGILNGLKKHFFQAKVSHIYASTEAGVGFSVKDGRAGFPRSYLEHSPDPSIKLKVSSNLLWIKSQRASESLISGNLEFDSEGFMNTGDLVELEADRVFFKGRDSGSINVGGNKVIPEDVEQILLQHPAVAQCHVYGKKNPMMGMLVVADIVLAPSYSSAGEVKTQLQSHCKVKLSSYKVPALFKFVDEISTNATGKIVRKV